MKFHKFISMGILVTLIAVGYVHQRVEIVKTGYNLQKNRKDLARVVDQNSKLMYNLSKLESPRNLLISLSGEEIEFAAHKTGRKNNCQIASSETFEKSFGGSLIEKFFDLFTLSAEAEPRE